MPVALAGRGVGARARHGAGAWWDDHRHGRVGLARSHGAVDRLAVVGAIGGDRGDGSGDLIERRADLRGVALLGGGRLGGEDLAALRIDREMEKLWGGGDVNHHRRRTQADGDAPCHGRTT